MSKRSFRTALIVVVTSLLVLGGVVLYLKGRVESYSTERHNGSADEFSVTIDKGMNFPAIAKRLSNKGVVDSPRWFRIYAMRRGVTTKVRSGQYILRGNMTPEEVLDKLLEGVKETNASITLPEGLNMLEVFAAFDDKGIADKGELEALARSLEFLQQNGIEGETADGYLFPDTYRFRVPTPPRKVLERMIRRHREVWAEVRAEKGRKLDRLMKKLKWSERDVLTMASIVEKEAVVNSERPRIAQVFINRLIKSSFKPHRLDTDPTIRYGCTVPTKKSAACRKWDPSKRLRTAQLRDVDNPYNTYQHEGLPPGPIGNPGRRSIEATIDADGSNYLFFVARGDGSHTHVFSRTRAEHERWVDKFQR